MVETGHILIIHHYFNLFDYRTWLSSLIRKKTKCDWNHVEIIQVHDFGMRSEIEIVGGISKGFIGRAKHFFITERPMMYEIWKPKQMFTSRQKAMIVQYKGKEYDYWSTLLWHGLEWLTGKWYGAKGIAATQKGNCSEIIADIYGMTEAYKATTADILNSGLFERTDYRL